MSETMRLTWLGGSVWLDWEGSARKMEEALLKTGDVDYALKVRQIELERSRRIIPDPMP